MVKCNQCKYEWKPKVKSPMACPKCKRYDWDSQDKEILQEQSQSQKI